MSLGFSRRLIFMMLIASTHRVQALDIRCIQERFARVLSPVDEWLKIQKERALILPEKIVVYDDAPLTGFRSPDVPYIDELPKPILKATGTIRTQDMFFSPHEMIFFKKQAYRVNRVSAGYDWIEADNAWGERHYFSLRQKLNVEMVTVTHESIHDSPWANNPEAPIYVGPGAESLPHFRIEDVDRKALERSIVNSQLIGSFGKVEKDLKVRAAMEAGVRRLVDLIANKKPLALEDLQDWNSRLRASALPSKDSEHIVVPEGLNEWDQVNFIERHREIERFSGGVVRGTESVKVAPFRVLKLDLRDQGVGWGSIINFVRPDRVPARIKDLVTRVNRIDEKTPLKDVAGLYREYISIHPFVDGNKRTSTLLLDYMLMKSGRPPIPHGSERMRLPFFQSLDSLEGEFLKTYGREGYFSTSHDVWKSFRKDKKSRSGLSK